MKELEALLLHCYRAVLCNAVLKAAQHFNFDYESASPTLAAYHAAYRRYLGLWAEIRAFYLARTVLDDLRQAADIRAELIEALACCEALAQVDDEARELLNSLFLACNAARAKSANLPNDSELGEESALQLMLVATQCHPGMAFSTAEAIGHGGDVRDLTRALHEAADNLARSEGHWFAGLPLDFFDAKELSEFESKWSGSQPRRSRSRASAGVPMQLPGLGWPLGGC